MSCIQHAVALEGVIDLDADVSDRRLFDAHTRSFTALGGVARRGIYYNMKTAVDRVGRGKTREVNQLRGAEFRIVNDADGSKADLGWPADQPQHPMGRCF